MKRTQQLGGRARGKVGVRKEIKKAQSRAERREAAQALKTDLDSLGRVAPRRFYGYDD